jgi:hypothetical protein
MASSPARAVGDQAPGTVPLALLVDLLTYLAAMLVGEVAAGDAARTSSLVAALAAVPDVRHRRGRRHEPTGVPALAACGCLTGATSYVAISEWAAAQGAAVLACLGAAADERALPCQATLRRCLRATDAAALDAAVAGGPMESGRSPPHWTGAAERQRNSHRQADQPQLIASTLHAA